MADNLINSQILNETYANVVQINKGGGGTIYKAYHKRLQKDVVLKKIHSRLAGKINSRGEADILKNLRHSYLPQVLDFLEVGNDIYTVMDFIPGNSLKEIVESGYRFSQEQVIKYTEQLCEALAYLHAQVPPIIHCDIKPANIMITPQDNVCLIDFNISGVFGEEDQSMGFTQGYAAPEQIYAFQYKKNMIMQMKQNPQMQMNTQMIAANCPYKIDTRTDVYSLGVTLFYILTGVKPSQMQGTFSDYLQIDTRYHDGLVHILLKATQENPDGRYLSAVEMLTDVKNISKLTRNYKNKSKIKVITASICMVAAAACIVGGVLFFSAGSKAKEKEYEAALSKMESAVNQSDENQLKIAFDEATKINEKKLGAYYYELLMYYNAGKYQEAIDYIGGISKKDDQNKDDTYYAKYNYILGKCYDELDNDTYAVAYYRAASEADSSNATYARDYAIALARAGNVSQAQEVLSQAEKAGAQASDLDMIRGELAYAQKDYEGCKNYCDSVVKSAADEKVKLRGYILKSEAMEGEDNSTIQGITANIAALTEAKSQISKNNQLVIVERQVYYYTELINLTGAAEYYSAAEKLLNEEITNGWATSSTYDNLYVIYRTSGQYAQAKEMLKKELDLYNNQYDIYKKLAFVEMSMQAEKANTERNYTEFKGYYEKAEELFSSSKKEDPEMTVLKNNYNELVKGGWIQ